MDYSVGKIILLTFLILTASSCKNLFSNSLKELIEQNRFVQHLILLILIITLLSLFNKQIGDDNDYIIVGMIIYIFFIFMTKLDIKWFISIISLIVIYSFFENKNDGDILTINNDMTLDETNKYKLIKNLTEQQKYFLSIIGGLTLVGTGIYFFEKKTQVMVGGGEFDYFKFIFG
jgi:chromate transport protein ChrA